MRRVGQIDYSILIPIFLLVVFGLTVLASASSDLGKVRFDDSYYYLRHQLTYGLSVGLLGFLAGFLVPYKYYKKFSVFFLFITIGGLILVFTPLGVASGGSERWLAFGPLTIQPSEVLKITFMVYLAAWLAGSKSVRSDSFVEGFLPFLAVSGVISLLLVLEKSTSSVIIIMASALVVYFISGARKRYIFYALLLGALGVGLLTLLTPYRLERVKTFLSPSKDTQNAGYQINRSLITIGSGGILGVGYGQSVAKRYLPERVGDSIFPIVAEEFGFVGSVTLITLFFFLVLRIYQTAKKVGDRFGKLLLVGFATIIGLQVFIHIGSNAGLTPLTGVPLPFISYGGTALAIFLTMSGIAVNISKYS